MDMGGIRIDVPSGPQLASLQTCVYIVSANTLSSLRESTAISTRTCTQSLKSGNLSPKEACAAPPSRSKTARVCHAEAIRSFIVHQCETNAAAMRLCLACSPKVPQSRVERRIDRVLAGR
jgi:hypothetical protein